MKNDRINLLRWHERLSDWANETPKRKKLLEWSLPIWLLIVVPWGTFMVSSHVLQQSEAARDLVRWGIAIFPYLDSMLEWGEIGEKPLFLFCVYHFTVWLPVMLSSIAARYENTVRANGLGIFLLMGLMLPFVIWGFIHLGHSDSLAKLARLVAGPRSSAMTTAWITFGTWTVSYLLVLSILGVFEELYEFIQKIKKIMEGM